MNYTTFWIGWFLAGIIAVYLDGRIGRIQKSGDDSDSLTFFISGYIGLIAAVSILAFIKAHTILTRNYNFLNPLKLIWHLGRHGRKNGVQK